MQHDNMMLGDWITYVRQDLGCSRAEFAKRLGVTERAVRYWENDQRKPAKPTMKLIMILALDEPPHTPPAPQAQKS